jgi:hypothetical protein
LTRQYFQFAGPSTTFLVWGQTNFRFFGKHQRIGFDRSKIGKVFGQIVQKINIAAKSRIDTNPPGGVKTGFDDVSERTDCLPINIRTQRARL